MPTVDPRIDAYIEKSAEFAQPILIHLRKLVHKACPDVVETMKWSSPHFDYKGMLCSMAGFKAHVAFGFWKHSLLESNKDKLQRTAMGSFGRITSKKDLPDDKTLIGLIHEAMALNEKGVKVRKKPAGKKTELVIPNELTTALSRHKNAKAEFDRLSYSHQKEYVEWITEAKTEPTRNKRLAQTVEWLSEGKSKNWKYQNC